MEKISEEIEGGDKSEAIIEASEVIVNPETKLAVVVIKPDAFLKRDEIVKQIENSGLHVVKRVIKKLPLNFVLGTMYKDLPESISNETGEHFMNGPSEIILLKGGEDILSRIIDLTGENTDPQKCDKESIRYIFGEHFGRETEDGKIYRRNAIHRAKNEEERRQDLDKFEHWL